MPSLGFLSIVSILLAFFGWRIAARAGYSPLWGLTALVPPLGILALWYLAFGPWPAAQARMSGSANMSGHDFTADRGRAHTSSAYARTERDNDARM